MYHTGKVTFALMTASLVAAVPHNLSDSAVPDLTMPKANEYQSVDCTGDINYGHHSWYLKAINMDATSNSVYVTAGDGQVGWKGYSGARIGGSDSQDCGGSDLGWLSSGCNSLVQEDGTKINCIVEP